MKSTTDARFAAMRAELVRDYAPANAQERLLVGEVAEAWRRLDSTRLREQEFFKANPNAPAKAPAYSQLLRALNEAQVMFDRAVRTLQYVQRQRHKVERLDLKAKQTPAVSTAITARPASRVKNPSQQVHKTKPNDAKPKYTIH